MGKLKRIELQIKELSPQEIGELRECFASFDAAEWDRKFDPDVRSGKLDELGEEALMTHASSATTKL